MERSEGVCDVCGSNYIPKEEKDIGGSKYKILKCEKCNHQVARREE